MTFRRLGINAIFLAPRMGGLETYLRELVPEMLNARPGLEISLFVTGHGLPVLRDEPWAADVRFLAHPALGLPGLKAASELTVLGALAPRRGVDVLHSIALTGPLRTRSAHVVTIADVTWLLNPDPANRWTFALWRAVVPPVARAADRVIAIAEDGARDVEQHLRVPRERIDVVFPGFGNPRTTEPAPAAEVRRRFDLGDGRVILSVGGKRLHKNLHRLVEAMPQVLERHPGTVLVLVGKTSPYEDEVKATAERLGVAHAVRFPDYVETPELEGLYDVADLFVLPSTHEGFGLPIVEAQVRDVPVACSNVSSLPEAAGDAAVQFDPYDPADIARAVDAVLSDEALARRLVAAGRANWPRFTWRQAAEGTLESYDRAFSARR